MEASIYSHSKAIGGICSIYRATPRRLRENLPLGSVSKGWSLHHLRGHPLALVHVLQQVSQVGLCMQSHPAVCRQVSENTGTEERTF